MSCYHRMNEKFRDLNVVRILAKKAADALSVDMIIYKTICNGVQIFKFSSDWKGTQVEVVQHIRPDSGGVILQDTGDFRSISTKRAKRSGAENMGDAV